MPRVAVKLAYDGTRFSGSQRQPDVRTVEGDLIKAAQAIGAFGAPEAARFQVASRTDAGVSALGNVAAFDTDFRLDELARALTARLEDAWIMAAKFVDDDFRPRAARRRRYAYLLSRDAAEAAALVQALSVFVGHHDFTAFARIEEGVDPHREVSAIDVSQGPLALTITFEAPSFLWNQVRRMTWAGVEMAHGRLARKDVEAALASGQGESRWALADPAGLVLTHVEYDWAFPRDTLQADRLARAFAGRVAEASVTAARERLFGEALRE